VGRPPRHRNVARFRKGELLGRAADRLTPQVEHETVALPVGGREEVRQRSAVRRQLRREETRQLGELDQRERALCLRVQARSAREGRQADEARSEKKSAECACATHQTCPAHATHPLCYRSCSVVLLISFLSSPGAFSDVYGRFVAYFSNHSISALSLYS